MTYRIDLALASLALFWAAGDNSLNSLASDPCLLLQPSDWQGQYIGYRRV